MPAGFDGNLIQQSTLSPKQTTDLLRCGHTSGPIYLNKFGNGPGAEAKFDSQRNVGEIVYYDINFGKRAAPDSLGNRMIGYRVDITPIASGSQIEVSGNFSNVILYNAYKNISMQLSGEIKCRPPPEPAKGTMG